MPDFMNVFILSASGGQKQQFLVNFDFFGGRGPVPTRFTDEGQIWCAIATNGIRLRAKFRLDRFILSPSGGENPQFLPFLDFSI